MAIKVAIPDLVSPSYFPAIAAVTLGFLEREGLDAELELIYPVTRTYEELLAGNVDFAGGSAHAPVHVGKGWDEFSLLCSLSQNMYWFLVVRKGLEGASGDLSAVKGLRIGAAPGPVDGLREMFRSVGIDPDDEVNIGPVPGSADAGVSFGVTAAKALAAGSIDGFWANGMGADVAVSSGAGAVIIDARRGGGPAGSADYTFPAFMTTKAQIRDQPERARAATRAIVRTQKALAQDPDLAVEAVAGLFPADETSRIAQLIKRDAPFYDPRIPPEKVEALNAFTRQLGLLDGESPSYETVVAAEFQDEWSAGE
jgi:NitT/TauT family transport system substrate-binding protein